MSKKKDNVVPFEPLKVKRAKNTFEIEACRQASYYIQQAKNSNTYDLLVAMCREVVRRHSQNYH